MIPKQVDIFGAKFKVITNNQDKLNEHAAEGLVNFKTREIYLSPTLSKQELWQTLLHEMGHAVLKRTGITYGLSKEAEESIVDSIATCFVENFKF